MSNGAKRRQNQSPDSGGGECVVDFVVFVHCASEPFAEWRLGSQRRGKQLANCECCWSRVCNDSGLPTIWCTLSSQAHIRSILGPSTCVCHTTFCPSKPALPISYYQSCPACLVAVNPFSNSVSIFCGKHSCCGLAVVSLSIAGMSYIVEIIA